MPPPNASMIGWCCGIISNPTLVKASYPIRHVWCCGIISNPKWAYNWSRHHDVGVVASYPIRHWSRHHIQSDMSGVVASYPIRHVWCCGIISNPKWAYNWSRHHDVGVVASYHLDNANSGEVILIRHVNTGYNCWAIGVVASYPILSGHIQSNPTLGISNPTCLVLWHHIQS